MSCVVFLGITGRTLNASGVRYERFIEKKKKKMGKAIFQKIDLIRS